MVDPQQLGQVFMNLIINAADALDSQGRGTLTVGTRFDRECTSVVGFVEDDGPGIPQQHLEKVFDPYFTTKPQGKGTGLGLSIVRSIVEAHGGQVVVRSTPGEGTLVEFVLPLAP
jgi:signal transduction histidine kinase